MSQAVDDPLHAVAITVLLEPCSPTVGLEAVLLPGDGAQRLECGFLNEPVARRQQLDELGDAPCITQSSDRPGGVELLAPGIYA